MAYGYHGRAARSLEGLAVFIRHADDDVGGSGEMDFGLETLLTGGDGPAAQTFEISLALREYSFSIVNHGSDYNLVWSFFPMTLLKVRKLWGRLAITRS